METKKTIQEKLRKVNDFINYTQESEVLYFDCRGADINNPRYKGDIFNHRPVALLLLNGIKIVIEVGTTNTRRTLHKTTKRPLLHPVDIYDNNGLLIEYSVEDVPTFEKSSYYGYHFYPSSFRTNTDFLRDDLETGKSYHNTKLLLRLINAELKTHFKKAVFVNNSDSEIMTISEALKDGYIRDFDKQPLTPTEEITLTKRAKDRFEMLQDFGIIPSNKKFEDEYCWITSSSLQGVYFPNLNNIVRCFAFGVYGRVITCLNDED